MPPSRSPQSTKQTTKLIDPRSRQTGVWFTDRSDVFWLRVYRGEKMETTDTYAATLASEPCAFICGISCIIPAWSAVNPGEHGATRTTRSTIMNIKRCRYRSLPVEMHEGQGAGARLRYFVQQNGCKQPCGFWYRPVHFGTAVTSHGCTKICAKCTG